MRHTLSGSVVLLRQLVLTSVCGIAVIFFNMMVRSNGYIRNPLLLLPRSSFKFPPPQIPSGFQKDGFLPVPALAHPHEIWEEITGDVCKGVCNLEGEFVSEASNEDGKKLKGLTLGHRDEYLPMKRNYHHLIRLLFYFFFFKMFSSSFLLLPLRPLLSGKFHLWIC